MPKVKIHRKLHRGDHGPDVRQTQRDADHLLHHLRLGFLAPKIDGQLLTEDLRASAHAVYALGLDEQTRRQVLNGVVSERVQHVLRHPDLRGPVTRARAASRIPELRKWRRGHLNPIQEIPPGIVSAEHLIDFLISQHYAYVWGGGRTSSTFNGPGDCSWLAGRIWDKLVGGREIGTTFTEADWGLPGYGKVLTLHIYNGDVHNAHVISSLDPSGRGHTDPTKLRWFECGGSDNPTPGNGPTWFHPTQARIDHFPIKRHPVNF